MSFRQAVTLIVLVVGILFTAFVLKLVMAEVSALQPAATVVAPAAVVAEPTPVVLIGAGDISLCGQDGDERTAAILERLIAQYPQAAIFTAGDNVQLVGETSEYTDCFKPAWGRFQARIHPSPGNHDWYTRQAGPYFDYFDEAAGPDQRGYYSYDLGAWHILSLNSNCDEGQCGEDSAQARWLRADLNSHPSRCTLLYWHHPLWSSGTVPISPAGQSLWRIASEYGAEVVINGHDHHYERMTPLNWEGRVDREHGLREFIVGTGGAWLMELGDPLPETEARDNTTFGVLLFKLYPTRYEWEFVPVDGGSYHDSGGDVCH